MAHIADKPFTDVLLEHPSYDIKLSPLDNVIGNLARGVEKVEFRRAARQQQAALERAYRDMQTSQLRWRQQHRRQDNSAPEDWRNVPIKVAALLQAVVPIVRVKVAAWKPEDGDLWISPTGDLRAGSPPDPTYILVKTSNWLAGPRRIFTGAQELIGGPNPMTRAIVGGLLGSGLGYGAGALADRFLPESQFDRKRSRLRYVGALAGAGLGAAPGLWDGRIASRQPGVTGWEGWLSNWPFRPEDRQDWHGYSDVPPDFTKAAEEWGERGGMAFLPTIPVDAFNNAVWNDVGRQPNRFGTKSPWGDNTQPLDTPPPIAALASGLVSGASAARGNASHVSPWDVAVTASASGGVGLATGMLVGKTLGALAGLQPSAQKTLQNVGLWGGMLTGVLSRLF